MLGFFFTSLSAFCSLMPLFLCSYVFLLCGMSHCFHICEALLPPSTCSVASRSIFSPVIHQLITGNRFAPLLCPSRLDTFGGITQQAFRDFCLSLLFSDTCNFSVLLHLYSYCGTGCFNAVTPRLRPRLLGPG